MRERQLVTETTVRDRQTYRRTDSVRVSERLCVCVLREREVNREREGGDTQRE